MDFDNDWIVHEGKKIFRQTYRGLTPEEAIEKIDKYEAYLNENQLSDLRSLIDVSGVRATNDLVNKFKSSAKKNNSRYRKVAVTGTEGVRRMILKTVSMFSGLPLKPFESEEKAFDWLAKD